MVIKELKRFDGIFNEGESSITIGQVDQISYYSRRTVNNAYETHVFLYSFNMKTEIINTTISSIDFYQQLLNQSNETKEKYSLRSLTPLIILANTVDEMLEKLDTIFKCGTGFLGQNIPFYTK